MDFEEVAVPACCAVFLFAASISPAFLVWLGMMLVTSPNLVGIAQERIERMIRLRRGFARLIFRSLLWFVVLPPVLSLIWLISSIEIVSPIACATMFLLTFGLWWLYVVVGSLAHAWVALRILEEGEAQ